MNYVSATLGSLVDRALLELQAPAEQGLLVTITPVTVATTITFQVTSGTLNVSDIVEIGAELLLVTGKTNDATPVYTAQRGYYGTTQNVSYPAGTVGAVNPTWARHRVAEGVKRAFPRMEALGLPLLVSGVFTRATDMQYVSVPENVREVLRISVVESSTGRIGELHNWNLFQDLPTALYPTGKIVRLPASVKNSDSLHVVYRVPYRWSSYPAAPTEAATVSVPEGAEDLPALYASAWLVSAREISRGEIDRAEEWNRSEPQRGGVSLSLSRALWQNFYRALDEARRLNLPPLHRPYVKRPKFAGVW